MSTDHIPDVRKKVLAVAAPVERPVVTLAVEGLAQRSIFVSHKIAKAHRAAERGIATPRQMHTILTDMTRQLRRADAHKLKAAPKVRKRRTASTRLKGKVRQATKLLRGILEI